MSFMIILNKMGLRNYPCGTPSSILHHSLKLLFIFLLFEIVLTKALNIFYHIERKAIHI